MTIEEILQIKELKKLKSINTKADLSREAAVVESTEAPDVALYLPRQTFLLTTAMAFQNNPEMFCQFILDLDKVACAGLAVKLGRFVEGIDQKVIDVADELGFPLIQIPMDYTLGIVYHQILSCMWNNENHNLIMALNTQKKFYEMILQGSSMKNMLNNLMLILKRPVAIVDLFGDIYESSYDCRKEERELIVKTFQVLTEEDSGILKKLSYMDEQYVKGDLCLFPIKGIGRNTHYLCISNIKNLPEEINELVIRQVLLTLGMYLYKSLYLIYNQVRSLEEFWKVLLNQYHKETWSANQLLMLGERYGFKPSGCYRVITGRTNFQHGKAFDTDNFGKKEEQYLILYSWMKEKLVAAFRDNILLLPDTSTWSYILIVQGECVDLEEALSGLSSHIQRCFGAEMIFAFGNNTNSPETLNRSYHEALESFENGRNAEKYPWIRYFQPQSIMDLLSEVSGNQVQQLCQYTLKELAYPQDEMTKELKKTLQTYLECHCSVARTADLMFLHRNTVKYRIKKCEEILGQELSDSSYCLQLQMSLMLSDC